ncbi:Copine family protein [Histomonas meleagridis]|uniref:Copine family protein n=1 Tax=Histomonas meleagridis TaxID=135588 RepID=UPI00355AA245|nr:Copine family protein [Histomonas meleagridis]KAH0798011.1 Copine family protein [Histomonas meleagridis]
MSSENGSSSRKSLPISQSKYNPYSEIANYITTDLTYSLPIIYLNISAQKLQLPDNLTESNCICVLFLRNKRSLIEVGRTEPQTSPNPNWSHKIKIVYRFEMKQLLIFRVYSVSANTNDLSKQIIIGESKIQFSKIITNNSKTELKLKNSQQSVCGSLYINSSQIDNCSSLINGQILGVSLKRHSLIFQNEVSFSISKKTTDGNYVTIYNSEGNKKMQWESFSIAFQLLCDNDPELQLRISFFDHKKSKSSQLVGYHDSTYARLSESVNTLLPIVNNSNKNVGSFKILNLSLQQKSNFYDYLHNGFGLNVITAVDFTLSNGDPKDPKSLHYLDPTGKNKNQYEKCIRCIGDIMCPYDRHQSFPVLGFGAKEFPQRCFPLIPGEDSSIACSVDDILRLYRNAVSRVSFSGPTLLSPVIKNASQIALKSFEEQRNFSVLIILTDGPINDMSDTLDAIVEASRIPLSIIVVGIGEDNFESMVKLDSNKSKIVNYAGRTLERDLIRFIRLKDLGDEHLAEELLKEIPRQSVQWAEMNGVKPYNR